MKNKNHFMRDPLLVEREDNDKIISTKSTIKITKHEDEVYEIGEEEKSEKDNNN
jgi:hypothetical protein